MTIHVKIDESDTQLLALRAAAMRGEEIVLDVEGQPSVRLAVVTRPVPAEALTPEQLEERAAKRRAALGMWRHKYDKMPDLDISIFQTSDEEIEERYRRKFGDLR